MIAPESKPHLRRRPHPIRPLRPRANSPAGPPHFRHDRQGARVLRSPSPPARPDPSRRAGTARTERGRGGPVAKGGAAEGVSGTARPCSPPRCGDRRPPGSGPPGASEGSVAGWGAEATNGPPRPAPVNQPRVREGVGGPIPDLQAKATSRVRECEPGRAVPATRAAPGPNLKRTEKSRALGMGKGRSSRDRRIPPRRTGS